MKTDKELIKQFKDIDLIYEFLETLEDLRYFNSSGLDFKKDFYEEWIKK